MPERTLMITNKLGLHARAAAKLVQTAARFKAEVRMARTDDETEVNAKSIMGVLMLAAAMGTEVRLRTDGEEAEPAMRALVELIEGKFGEE